MCLARVRRKYRKPYKLSGTAYKLFLVGGGHLKFQYYPLKGCVKPTSKTMIAPRGRWLKSTEDRVLAGDDVNDVTHYPSGFHLYASRWGAENIAGARERNCEARVVEVRWRGLKARGIQSDVEVIVVDEIYIPRDKK